MNEDGKNVISKRKTQSLIKQSGMNSLLTWDIRLFITLLIIYYATFLLLKY